MWWRGGRSEEGMAGSSLFGDSVRQLGVVHGMFSKGQDAHERKTLMQET